MPDARLVSPRIIASASRLEVLLPPRFRQIAEQRRLGGMRDSRPTRHPLRGWEIKRHDIKAGKQYSIERASGGNEIIAGCRPEHGADHGVDCFRPDPHVIATALLIGGGGPPIEQLLVAGRQRLLPAVFDHVEIESDAAAFVLSGVDVAYAGLDAAALEIANKGKRNALLIARGGENLERQRLSGRRVQ